MPDPTSGAPGAAAGGGAPSGGGAAASSSSPTSPTTTTGTPAAGSPAAGAAGTPGTAAGAAAPITEESIAGKSTLEVVRELAKGPKKDPPADPAAAANAAAAADAAKAGAAAADPAKKDPAAVAAAAGADGEKKDPAVAAEGDDAEEVQNFDMQETPWVNPQTLSQWMGADPDFKKFLDGNPDKRALLFSTLRHADRALEVAKLVRSPREAQFLTAQAGIMRDLEGGITNLKEGGFNKIAGIIMQLDTRYDEDTGEPVMRDWKNPATGQTIKVPDRYGYADQFYEAAGMELLNSVEKAAQDDASLLAAVKLVKESITRASSASDEGMTEEQKQRESALKAEESRIAGERETGRLEKRRAVEDTVRTEAVTSLTKKIEAFCARTDLDAFKKNVVVQNVITDFYATLEKDPLYVQQRDYLIAQPQTKKVRDERKAMTLEAMNTYLPNILRKRFTEAGAKILKEQAARAANQKTAEDNSRHEVKGGGAAPLPSAAAGTPEAELSDVEQKLTTQLGRKPSTLEITRALVTSQRERVAAAGR